MRHDLIFLVPFVASNIAILKVDRLYWMYYAHREAHLKMIADRDRLTIVQDNVNVFLLESLESSVEIDFEIHYVV